MAEASMYIIKLELKRKPLLIVVNVLLPIAFLSVLNVLVFIIPVDSGQRVSYCITVLLSISVFFTIVSDTLPKSSDPHANNSLHFDAGAYHQFLYYILYNPQLTVVLSRRERPGPCLGD